MQDVKRKYPVVLLTFMILFLTSCRKFDGSKDLIPGISSQECSQPSLNAYSLRSLGNLNFALSSCAVLNTDETPPLIGSVPAGGKFGLPTEIRMLTNETATAYFTIGDASVDENSTIYNSALRPVIANSGTFRFFAKDLAGNKSASFSTDFMIEPGIPTINIQNVSSFHTGIESLIVNGENSISIDFSVNKSASYSVELSQAGKGDGQILESGSYSVGSTKTIQILGSSLQGGVNYLYITVVDTNGKEGYAVLNLIRNDTYTLTRQSQDSGVYSTPFWLSLSSENISQIYYTLDGSDPTVSSAIYSTPLYFSATSTLKYFSIDAAGNIEPIRTGDFTFDYVAPIVTIDVPASLSASVSNGGGGPTEAELRFTADEVGTYTVELGGGGLGTGVSIFTGAYAVSGSQVILQIQASSLADGVNNLYVYLTDIAGNSGSAAYTLLLDSVAKTPVIYSPSRNSMFSTLPISFSWTEPALDASEVSGFGSYVFQIDNTINFATPIVNATGLVSNTYTVSAGLASGVYYARIRFIDSLGNQSQFSAPTKFNIGKAPKDLNGDGYSDFAIGAPFHDIAHSALVENGKVYIYFGAAVLGTIPAIEIISSYSNERFGKSIAIINDLNGDGFSDFAIGAENHSSGLLLRGRVYVFYGGTYLAAKCGIYFTCTLSASQADMILDGEKTGELFGTKVVDLGDLNSDGFSELGISSRNYDGSGGTNIGRVYIFAGSASPSTIAIKTLTGTIQFEEMGFGLAGAADINADGFDDVLVGAPFQNKNISGTNWFNTGMVRLFSGVADLAQSAEIFNWNIAGDNNLTGYSLSSGIDINRDGFPDILSGGPQSDRYVSSGGNALLFLGGISGAASDINYYPVSQLNLTPTIDLFDGSINAQYGYSVSLLGDINSDSYAEWVVCSPFAANGGLTFAGRCYLYNYSGGMLNLLASTVGLTANENFGSFAARLGDINGDSIEDFIITSPRRVISAVANTGQARIYLGKAGFNFATPDLVLTGEGLNDYFGQSTSGE